MNLPSPTIKNSPLITKQRALAIAAQALFRGGKFECYSERPSTCRIYGINIDQPCWYIYAPWADGMHALRSSRVMVISRLTGKIIYDGSAGDEG